MEDGTRNMEHGIWTISGQNCHAPLDETATKLPPLIMPAEKLPPQKTDFRQKMFIFGVLGGKNKNVSKRLFFNSSKTLKNCDYKFSLKPKNWTCLLL